MNKFFFVLVLFFCSCSDSIEKEQNKPSDLIPKDKMAIILKDLMLIESHFQIKYAVLPRYKEGLLVSADSLFVSHGVNSKQFEKSYDYYLKQNGELHDIYRQILDTLNVEYTRVNAQKDI